MARTYINTLLGEARGRIGEIVIKRYKYGAVVSRVPRPSPVPRSEKQVAQNQKWLAAAEYYRRVKADPALAACYARLVEKTGYPLSALTTRDFHRPPTILGIDLQCYHGHAGDIIEVQAHDDVCVVGVTLTICDTAGQIIESGPAVNDYGRWRYVGRGSTRVCGALTIKVMAQDLPGNQTTATRTWCAPGVVTAPCAIPPVSPAPPDAAAAREVPFVPEIDVRSD